MFRGFIMAIKSLSIRIDDKMLDKLHVCLLYTSVDRLPTTEATAPIPSSPSPPASHWINRANSSLVV